MGGEDMHACVCLCLCARVNLLQIIYKLASYI